MSTSATLTPNHAPRDSDMTRATRQTTSVTAAVARKSLVTCEQIRAGTRIEKSQIAIMRPGTGLAPAMLPYVVGRAAKIDIQSGELITFEMLK